MKFSPRTLCLLLIGSVAAIPAPLSETPVSYDGTKVVRVQLDESQEQTAKLKALIDGLGLDTWTHAVAPKANVDIVVSPEKIAAFDEGVEGMQIHVMHEDLGKSIKEENGDAEKGFAGAQLAVDLSWFNAYHSYADHLNWLNQVVAQYPSNAKIVTAGNSYQGRPITGLHIYGSSGGGARPAAVIHGTVHAREWITTMVTEFLAYQLLNNYANSTAIKTAVDKFDFYIFPVTNPDGFLYTQSTDRMWRKSRQPNTGSTCVGTDINRNWNAYWSNTGGASTSPCSETYKGTAAASTAENKALSSFQDGVSARQGVRLFMDIHSYSQLWMTPYGYSCSRTAANAATQNAVAAGAAAALRAVYGTSFRTGPVCNTIYQVTGGSNDYSYDTTKATFSFALELRDTGSYGFILPANQIYPSGNEMWEAFKYTLANI